MKKDEIEKPTDEALKGYNPANRDFQSTEKDIDNVSKSEKESLEKQHKEEKKHGKKEAD